MKALTIVNLDAHGTLVQNEGSNIHLANPICQRFAADEVAKWIFENMPPSFVEKLERECIRHRAEREQNLGIALGKHAYTRYLLDGP